MKKKNMDPGLIMAIISACVKVCEWIFSAIIAWINSRKK
jgi:hypothetical protein